MKSASLLWRLVRGRVRPICMRNLFNRGRRPTNGRAGLLHALAAAVCLGPVSCSPSGMDLTLQGSGATFPAPLYKRWFLEFYKKRPEIRINYTAVGSGAGIRQFTTGLVSFGAS